MSLLILPRLSTCMFECNKMVKVKGFSWNFTKICQHIYLLYLRSWKNNGHFTRKPKYLFKCASDWVGSPRLENPDGNTYIMYPKPDVLSCRRIIVMTSPLSRTPRLCKVNCRNLTSDLGVIRKCQILGNGPELLLCAYISHYFLYHRLF
jgi:hypothetical protein